VNDDLPAVSDHQAALILVRSLLPLLLSAAASAERLAASLRSGQPDEDTVELARELEAKLASLEHAPSVLRRNVQQAAQRAREGA
jgi:hypothetical protein